MVLVRVFISLYRASLLFKSLLYVQPELDRSAFFGRADDDDGAMNRVDDDVTMKGYKIQGGFCWYRLIFIKSGSESPDV